MRYLRILLLFFSLLSCEKEREKILKYIIEEKIRICNPIFNEGWFSLGGANGNNLVFTVFNRHTLLWNIKRNTFDTLYKWGDGPLEACGGYGIFFENKLFCLSPMSYKMLIMEIKNGKYNIIKEAKIPIWVYYFINVLNDSLLAFVEFSIDKIFIIYDWKNEKIVNEFGDAPSYPIKKWNNKISDEGKYPSYDAAVKDTFLFFYDYYRNKFYVYNIFNGKKIKTFGRSIPGWCIPQIRWWKERSRFTIPNSPMISSVYNKGGICVSDKYIFAGFGKEWKGKWQWKKKVSKKKRTKILTDHYYFIDIYSLKDFNYIGTIYPFDEFIYDKEKDKILWPSMLRISGENNIDIYLNDVDLSIIKWIRIKVEL